VKAALLHEGTEDLNLIKQLASSLDFEFYERVQSYKMGKKSNFFDVGHADYRELLQLVEAEQIDKVLFVLDADDPRNDQVYGGYDNTLEELDKIVGDIGLKPIARIFICCDPQTGLGNIESLLLSTLDAQKKDCVEHFLECSEFGGADNDKAVLNAIYRKGFPNAPYDYSHEHFADLKAKISWLLSGDQD